MTTATAIANRALQLLGAPRISDIAQTENRNARELNAAYSVVRDALLRKYAWNFSIRRASVAADVSEDLYEGLNRYRKPNDFIRFLREPNTSFWLQQRSDWQVEGEFILTSDTAPLQFRYIARISEALFDPLFSEVLAIELALATCKQITGSLEQKADLKQDMAFRVLEARQANAFENDSDDPVEDSWVRTMYTNGFQGRW